MKDLFRVNVRERSGVRERVFRATDEVQARKIAERWAYLNGAEAVLGIRPFLDGDEGLLSVGDDPSIGKPLASPGEVLAEVVKAATRPIPSGRA